MVKVTATTTEVVACPEYPNLKPWKKGQSGNPEGKIGLERESRAIARRAAPEIMERLVHIALDPEEDSRVASVVGLAVLEQAFGKPRPFNPAEDNPRAQMDYSKLSDKQLRQLKSLVLKAAKLPPIEGVGGE